MVYYGSTSHKYPIARYQLHTSQYRCGKLRCSSKTLFDEYGLENILFQIIEECDDKLHCREREKWWILNTPCVNILSPILTNEEKRTREREARRIFREANPLPPMLSEAEKKTKKKAYQAERKEQKALYDKEYNISNREKLSEKHTCIICGGKYVTHHKLTHDKTQRHIRAKNA